MSEPRSRAQRVHEVVPGLYRWSVHDDRIGGAESDAYAVVESGEVTLVDPLPIDVGRLSRLGAVRAIVLTAPCHQRSAWRLRRALGAPVLAPEGPAVGPEPGELEEEPDRRYHDGDALPGGLLAVHAPGPDLEMHALWHPRTLALFLSDLLVHEGRGNPTFVPNEYQEDPRRTRDSVRAILARFPVAVACFGHGPPIVESAREALARALAADGAPGIPAPG